jgi:hypothetical protein
LNFGAGFFQIGDELPVGIALVGFVLDARCPFQCLGAIKVPWRDQSSSNTHKAIFMCLLPPQPSPAIAAPARANDTQVFDAATKPKGPS